MNKMLRRVSTIRNQVRDSAESGPGAQMEEAVAQLQSMAVSLDRVALQCDAVDAKLAEIVERGPGGQGAQLDKVLGEFRDALAQLSGPVEQIRDHVQRSLVERMGDEVRRTLFNLGYDRVDLATDLTELENGEGKVQVEVQREGVKSKGYVVLKDGSVVEQKISPTYEMFP